MKTPTHAAPPLALHRLVLWRDSRIKEAQERGDEFFMGVPDAWYEPPTWACGNGHVSARYLKSEVRGTVCLACQTPLLLIPHITEAELAEILSENVPVVAPATLEPESTKDVVAGCPSASC